DAAAEIDEPRVLSKFRSGRLLPGTLDLQPRLPASPAARREQAAQHFPDALGARLRYVALQHADSVRLHSPKPSGSLRRKKASFSFIRAANQRHDDVQIMRLGLEHRRARAVVHLQG